MHVFKEVTNDHGCPRKCYASDNQAEYILTSAQGKDQLAEYERRYGPGCDYPSSKWYNKHFNWERLK